MQSATQSALTSRELSGMVDLLLASSTQEQTQFVLDKPRQAIQQSGSGPAYAGVRRGIRDSELRMRECYRAEQAATVMHPTNR